MRYEEDNFERDNLVNQGIDFDSIEWNNIITDIKPEAIYTDNSVVDKYRLLSDDYTNVGISTASTIGVSCLGSDYCWRDPVSAYLGEPRVNLLDSITERSSSHEDTYPHVEIGSAIAAGSSYLGSDYCWRDPVSAYLGEPRVNLLDSITQRSSLHEDTYPHVEIGSAIAAGSSYLGSDYGWRDSASAYIAEPRVNLLDSITERPSLLADNYSHVRISSDSAIGVSCLGSDYSWRNPVSAYVTDAVVNAFDTTNKYSLVSNANLNIETCVISGLEVPAPGYDWQKRCGSLSTHGLVNPFHLNPNNTIINKQDIEEFSVYSKSQQRVWHNKSAYLELYQKQDINKERFENLICAKANNLKVNPDIIGFEYPDRVNRVNGVKINIYFVFNSDIKADTVQIGDTINSNYE